jgi:hypothetical protein
LTIRQNPIKYGHRDTGSSPLETSNIRSLSFRSHFPVRGSFGCGKAGAKFLSISKFSRKFLEARPLSYLLERY